MKSSSITIRMKGRIFLRIKGIPSLTGNAPIGIGAFGVASLSSLRR
jgi:hypothetical protein